MSKHSKNKITVIPKDDEERVKDVETEISKETVTRENVCMSVPMSPDMKEEMLHLWRTNRKLFELIVLDSVAADTIATKMSAVEKPFDFSWSEYTLRDVVIRQFDSKNELNEQLKMLQLNDRESFNLLKTIRELPMSSYMTILLYYGAPANSIQAFSHVRFVDVMGIDETSKIHRKTFLGYTKEI